MSAFEKAEEKVLNFCNGVGLAGVKVRYTLRKGTGYKVTVTAYNDRQERNNTIVLMLDSNFSITKTVIVDAFGKVFRVSYDEFDDGAKLLAS